MYKPGDIIAEVALRALQVCAGRGRNHFSHLGRNITINAKQFEWGFTIYLRKDFKPATLIFKVYTGTQRLRREFLSLKCPTCQKFCRWAYLDWDTLQGLCRKCYKLPYTHERHHPKPARWMKTDYHTFQRLFKKRIAILVAGITMKQIRAMKAPEFFQVHPYLVPPFFEMIAQYDTGLYEKSLRLLMGIYKQGVYLWKFPKLSDAENYWLDRNIAERLSGNLGMLKGESEWMKQNLEPLKAQAGSESAGESSSPGSEGGNGNPSGTPLEPSKSQALETGSSLSRTNSNPGMSAEPVEEPEASSAGNVQEKEFTSAKAGTSNALLAKDRDSSSARSAEAKADSSSSPNSPNADPLPEESSLLATR